MINPIATMAISLADGRKQHYKCHSTTYARKENFRVHSYLLPDFASTNPADVGSGANSRI